MAVAIGWGYARFAIDRQRTRSAAIHRAAPPPPAAAPDQGVGTGSVGTVPPSGLIMKAAPLA